MATDIDEAIPEFGAELTFARAASTSFELPLCSSYGLRKAMATRLAEAGATTEQIKAITGHELTQK